MPSWTLENVKEIQDSAPYTFYRPSEAIIDCLKPHEATVKLMFSFESDETDVPAAERMWVILDEIAEDGSFKGTLDNDPYYIKDLKAGDEVRFKREHIMQYHTLEELDIDDENAGKLEPYLKRCIVSNEIMKNKKRIGYIYRKEPTEDKDSGWYIMTGEENETYLENTDNFQYIALGVVLNNDDSFIHLLNEPAGSEFERDIVTGTFFLIS
jgi:hypothetical protein